MRVSLPIAIVLATAFTLPAMGCRKLAEKAEEKAIQKQTGGEVSLDEKKGELTIVTDAGSMSVGATTKVPDDFPREVPIYPGAKPTLASKSSDGKGKQVWSLTFESPDGKDQVVAFYKSHMSGFTVATSMDMGSSAMNVYQSPKYDVTVMVGSESGNKVGLTLNVVSK